MDESAFDAVWHQSIAEGFGRASESGQASCLEPRGVGLFPDVDVVLTVAEHAVDQACQLAGDGEHSYRAAFLTRRATECGAEGRLRALQSRRRHAQHARQAVRAQTLAATSERLAARDRGARTIGHAPFMPLPGISYKYGILDHPVTMR